MSLSQALDKLSNINVLVIGDVMLDEFHWCEVERISPEAPVPVCRVLKTSYAPGGAGNVANNIQSLGGKSILIGQIGQDGSANNLSQAFQKMGISQDYLVKDPSRSTILKSRIIAKTQQVARVDREAEGQLSGDAVNQLKAKVAQGLEMADAVVISDYGKGTLSNDLIQELIQAAKAKQIPVLVDPKGDDYQKYKGAYAITPNFKEFQEAIGSKVSAEADIAQHATTLCQNLDLEWLIITRSEKGMSLVNKDGRKIDIPTKASEVADITGAGDTVIAGIALGLGAGLDSETSAHLANYAAGISVSKVGTVAVSQEELRHEIQRDPQ